MNATLLFRRSQAGQQALDTRDKRLSSRMRALMLMAEGKPARQFVEIARALGAPEDAFDQLMAQGFVDSASAAAREDAAQAGAPPDGFARFRAASGLIREIAADAMGLKGFFFILKVEKCATLQDLEKLLPDLMSAMAKSRGSANADQVEAQLRSMLA